MTELDFCQTCYYLRVGSNNLHILIVNICLIVLRLYYLPQVTAHLYGFHYNVTLIVPIAIGNFPFNPVADNMNRQGQPHGIYRQKHAAFLKRALHGA